ncbi:MAG TPA: NAD-dependent epimerase/dehydratase family protein [Gemmatimonadaceae bacterium]|nr:NAD-dependent epimerase/dehydratase family protein [Gemmatimonadaceae bacterium]
MTAIVTGATGFIGKHLVDVLAAGGTDVRCLTRGRAGTDARPNVSFHQASYDRDDLGLPDSVLSGVREVYHLAGATRAVSSGQFTNANVTVTERVLDRVQQLAPAARFVLVSSQAAAGPARDAQHPRVETDPEAPIEDYGKSKAAAERVVKSRSDLEWTIARPVAVYGPGDRDFLSIFAMVKRGIAVYPGIRNSVINTVYVSDAAAGIIAAARSPAAIRKTYFLGDDTPESWKEIYRVIGETIGLAQPVEISIPKGVVAFAGAVGDVVGSLSGRPSLLNSSKATLAAPKYWLCSSARARQDFGFSATTSLRDGMRMTYDWYLRHRWL